MRISSPQSGSEPHAPRWGLVLTLCLAVVAAAHQGALTAGFAWDDHALIEKKESVHALQPLLSYFTNMFWFDPLSLESRPFYRPLVSLSFTLDWLQGAGSPFPFHLTNLLAHLACVALLFFWLRNAGASTLAAGLASALWGTFPRLTESVSWVSGRTDVFATLGVLGGLVLWPFDSAEPRLARRLAASLALLLGLFSKEVAIAGVLGIAAVEWLRRTGPLRSVLPRLAPLGVVTLVYCAGRVMAHESLVTILPLGGWRPVFALQAIGTYVTMLIDFRPSAQIGLLGIIEPFRLGVGVLAVGAHFFFGARWWRRRPASLLLCSALVGLIGLSLVLHLVPLPINVVACDRFLYLPLAMLAVAATTVMDRHRRALGVGAVVLIIWSVSTFFRAQVWNDEVLLFADLVKSGDPRNSLPPGVLGDVMLDRHHPAQAAELYRRSFLAEERYGRERLGGSGSTASPVGRINLAIALEELGHWPEAGVLFDQLRSQRPAWPRARYGLVMWALRQHDWARAARELEEAEKDLGRTEVSERLRGGLIRLRAEGESLPPESEGEPFDLAMRRLRLALELGGVAETNTRWQQILGDPGCAPSCAQEGVAWLAVHADPPIATAALRANVGRVEPDAAVALEALLAQRTDEVALFENL